jgi:hypothetical protein
MEAKKAEKEKNVAAKKDDTVSDEKEKETPKSLKKSKK